MRAAKSSSWDGCSRGALGQHPRLVLSGVADQHRDRLVLTAIVRQVLVATRNADALRPAGRAYTSLEHSAYQGVSEYQYSVGLRFEWDLLERFERRDKVNLAQPRRREAENELAHAREKTVRQVWKAYNNAKVALSKQRAAASLLEASEKSWAAAIESYQHARDVSRPPRSRTQPGPGARTGAGGPRGDVDARRRLCGEHG
jgi:hypothetical protein